ncbi:MAG: succinyl-diaminopimelate desuccinylase [Actinomycetota bacterium]
MTDPFVRLERLAEILRELVDIESVSLGEEPLLDRITALMPMDRFDLVDDVDGVRCFLPRETREGASLILLAGHADTVPIGGAALPSTREGNVLFGRGTADMKAGLTVMLALAQDRGPDSSDVDLGFVFFGREELPITQSALLPLLERKPELGKAGLAVLLEPTANAMEVGCLGNLNATVTVHGLSAHSARPWLGRNAIHVAIEMLAPLAGRPAHEVEIDGLVYREVVSVTTIEGGSAANVLPDLVLARVNVRYAPNRSPAEAEAWLRGTLAHPDLDVHVEGNAPPGPVAVSNPLVHRLLRAGVSSVGPKQAWTPVAEFGMAGIDAVNLGPGDPRYAHTDEEQVDISALAECYDIIRRFLERPEEG